MPEPRRLRLVTAIADRLTAAGHTVKRDRQQPMAPELPLMLVFSGERTPAERSNSRTRCDMTISVIGFRLANEEAEIVGNEILSDIMTAVEAGDTTLGGLVLGEPGGLTFSGEQIFMPEAGEGVVAAEIIYSVPHTRVDGDPDIQ